MRQAYDYWQDQPGSCCCCRRRCHPKRNHLGVRRRPTATHRVQPRQPAVAAALLPPPPPSGAASPGTCPGARLFIVFLRVRGRGRPRPRGRQRWQQQQQQQPRRPPPPPPPPPPSPRPEPPLPPLWFWSVLFMARWPLLHRPYMAPSLVVPFVLVRVGRPVLTVARRAPLAGRLPAAARSPRLTPGTRLWYTIFRLCVG